MLRSTEFVKNLEIQIDPTVTAGHSTAECTVGNARLAAASCASRLFCTHAMVKAKMKAIGYAYKQGAKAVGV